MSSSSHRQPNRVTSLDSLTQPARRAAVLVCVLVVLLIVGLLISQTVQTLLLVRRGDDTRESLRQARELIVLGEFVLQQNAGKLPSQELIISLTEPLSEIGSTMDSQHTGRITFQRLEDGNTPLGLTRITATYRPGTPAEITATHIVADKEPNHATPQ